MINPITKIYSLFHNSDQKLIQNLAYSSGVIFGKQHPEMIPAAKMVAMGITVSQGSSAKADLEVATGWLLKYSPGLEKQIKFIILSVEVMGADLTPIILAFIRGMGNEK
jgi:hypothetical protein